MANNYFDFLDQNSQLEKPANNTPTNDDFVNLTARADADCQVVCDGDFLFLLNANQIAKEKAPAGQHILEFISIDHPEISVEKIVDFPEPGKNYLVVVKEFQELFSSSKKDETITPSVPKRSVYFVFYNNPITWCSIAGAFLSESDAERCESDHISKVFLDSKIVNHMVPCDWDSFFIFCSIDYGCFSTIHIDSCSNDYNQILAFWDNSLKGKKDYDGVLFEPSSDVGRSYSNEEKHFREEDDYHYFLLKVSGLNKVLPLKEF